MRAAFALLMLGCSLKTGGLGQPSISLTDATSDTAVADSAVVDVRPDVIVDSGAETRPETDAGCPVVAGDPCTTIARLPLPQTIDGSDSEFCGVPFVDLDAKTGELLVPSPAVFWPTGRARARIAWSPEGLHIHVAVSDASFAPAPPAMDHYRGDVVEIFAAGHTALTGAFDGDKNDKGAAQIMVTRPQLDGSSRAAIWYQKYNRELAPSDFKAVARTYGYDVEVFLSWTLLEGTAIGSGSQIGFDFAFNDRRDLFTSDDQYIGYRLRKPLPESFCNGLYCDDRVWCQPTLE
jgi:hypothetical protein